MTFPDVEIGTALDFGYRVCVEERIIAYFDDQFDATDFAESKGKDHYVEEYDVNKGWGDAS